VASSLGISVQAYGAIENGKVDLNISRVFAISKFYEVDFNKILNVQQGDTYSYSSSNNSGGYHVLNKGSLTISNDDLLKFIQEDFNSLKSKLKNLELLLNQK